MRIREAFRYFWPSCTIRLATRPGPARLVRGATAAAIVTTEVLVEEDIVLEMGVALELCRCERDSLRASAIIFFSASRSRAPGTIFLPIINPGVPWMLSA